MVSFGRAASDSHRVQAISPVVGVLRFRGLALAEDFSNRLDPLQGVACVAYVE